MHHLSELIDAYVSMDEQGKRAFLSLAREYARAREDARPRATLHLLPGALRANAAQNRPHDGLEQIALGGIG